MTRTLLVGLDAACWAYLNPLLAEGRLPVLQRLLDRGVSGTLMSTMPPWTPAAWATLSTGKNPGKHGVFDMLWRRPNSYSFSPTGDAHRRGTPFWKRLNEQGLRVGLVNVPFTFPPQPIDGFVLVGFGTPESATHLCYPRDALVGLEAARASYQPVVPAELLRSGAPEAILEAETRHQGHQVSLALELADRYEVDVLVINLMLTDHANHKMPNMALIGQAYERADADLGRLLEGFQPDHALLISDHGSSRLKGDFLLNRWLRDMGYLSYGRRTPDARDKAFNWVLMQWLQIHQGRAGAAERLMRRVLRSVVPRLPKGVRRAFFARLEAAIPLAEEYVEYDDEPDMSRSVLFPGSVYSGLLYLNCIKREPQGIVPAAERRAVLDEVAARLREVRALGSDQPLLSKVYAREELYGDVVPENAPDLILDAYDGEWNLRTSLYTPRPGGQIRERYFADALNGADYGWHSRDGVFVFSGPAFRKGQAAEEAALVDVPATLLQLCGVPLPEDYDGKVMVETFSEEWQKRPVQYQPGDVSQVQAADTSLPQDEADKLLEHLKALGYIE